MTLYPASSPTSCYSLPVPVSSLDSVAYHTNDEEFSDSESGTTGAENPIFFYVGSNATSPQYIGTTINGSQVLLDLSSEASQSGHLAVVLSGGQSLVLNNDGIHLYQDGCESVSSLAIANFTHQLASLGAAPHGPAQPQSQSRMVKRQATQETNFTVEVQMDKIVDANAPQPNMTFGSSPCTFQSINSSTDSDTVIWICQYPGEHNGQMTCENGFRSWVNGSSGSPIPSPRNVTDLIDYISPFLDNTAAAIGNFFPALTPILSQVTPFIQQTQQALTDTVQFGGAAMCQLLHQNDINQLLMQVPGMSSTYTVGAFVSPPLPVISANLVKPTASPTKEPPREVLPGQTGFPLVTALSFVPLPALPSLELPSLGIPNLSIRNVDEAVPKHKHETSAAVASPKSVESRASLQSVFLSPTMPQSQ